MPAAERHRFTVLDSWRGIAALAVVYRHINGTAPFLQSALHENLSRGVDFFFLLSGFVIAFSYGDRLSRGFPLLRYMLLRFGRIWPLHAAMVLAYVALELLLVVHAGGLPTGREPFTGPRDLAALPVSLVLLQDWVWPGRDLWNVQSWSVSVELGLYLAAALAWRAFGPRANWAGALLAMAAGLALFATASRAGHIERGVIGFGLGMGCWAVWSRIAWPTPAPAAASMLEIGLVAAALWFIAADAPLLFTDLVFAAMVLVYAGEGGIVSRALRTAPLRWLGTLSYALYMVHGLVIGRVFDLLVLVQARIGQQWVAAQLGGVDRILLPTLPALAIVALMLIASLVVAYPAWRLIEWPARGWSRRLADARAPAAPAPT